MNASQFPLPPIPKLSENARRGIEKILDNKTKPPGSLGRLEALAAQLGAIWGTTDLCIPKKAIVVMAGDHGVASSGVSAYPQEVSGQMLHNFAAGGAAVNVLARAAGAEVVAVDMGVVTAVDAPNVRSCRVGPGTKNLESEPAMTQEQAQVAVKSGIDLANTLADDGTQLIALGEMGIGNTTPASALTAVFTGAKVAQVTGRGTGIDEATLSRKIQVIESALKRSAVSPDEPWRVLQELGGFEIAGLAGVALGAASRRVPILLDGFITGAAALLAAALQPSVVPYYVAAHRSVEPGHHIALHAMGLQPLLELDLRLGEGSGAALALPLIDAAIHIVRDMATFETAGVSDGSAAT